MQPHSAQTAAGQPLDGDRDRRLSGCPTRLAVAAAAQEALWSSSTTPLSSSRSGRTIARRSLCSHTHAVSYEANPRASCKPRADTPFFCEVTNQIAASQVDNGVCERWKIVPAVAEVFSPHSAHIHSPVPVRQQPPLPQFGHENPYGSAVQPDTPDTPTRWETTTETPDKSAGNHAHRPDAQDRPQPRPYCTQADMQVVGSIPTGGAKHNSDQVLQF
jgi:hypothetical protein